MTPFPSSTAATTEIPLEVPQPSLRARLDAATMAILQTRDQVVRSLDKHLQELHALRRALGQGDTSLQSLLPAAPPSPVSSASLRAQPMAMPTRQQTVEPWPTPAATVMRKTPAMIPPRPAPEPEPAPVLPSTPLEKATLEELNAALAYAFAHVSSRQAQSEVIMHPQR